MPTKEATNYLLIALLSFCLGILFAPQVQENNEVEKVTPEWDTVVYVSVDKDTDITCLIQHQGFPREEALVLTEYFREFNYLPSNTVKAGSKIKLPKKDL